MNKIASSLLSFLFSLSGLMAQEGRMVLKSDFLNTKTEVQIFHLGDKNEIESIVYFTDGEKLMRAGFPESLMALFKKGKIPKTYLVFVSSVNLDSGVDKRNDYFFCNPAYLNFFEQELIPQVEKAIGQSFTAESRSLLGISFGGLNAAWFSAKSQLFAKYALLSPITYPCEKLIQDITFSKNKSLKIYLSTGKNDAENYVVPLQNIYNTKQYRIQFEKTQGGHDFENWLGQLESVFNFLMDQK